MEEAEASFHKQSQGLAHQDIALSTLASKLLSWNKVGNYFYKCVTDTKVNWDVAKADCEKSNGRLAAKLLRDPEVLRLGKFLHRRVHLAVRDSAPWTGWPADKQTTLCPRYNHQRQGGSWSLCHRKSSWVVRVWVESESSLKSSIFSGQIETKFSNSENEHWVRVRLKLEKWFRFQLYHLLAHSSWRNVSPYRFQESSKDLSAEGI